jgi:hypothetical protein
MSEHENLEPQEPGEEGLPLAFDVWADLSARLLNLGTEARLEILDEQGVDEHDWMRSDEHHCLALAEDVAAGRMERARRYAGACAAELERRKTQQAEGSAAALEAPPALASDPEAEPKIGAPLEAAPHHTPSFLQPRPAPAGRVGRLLNEVATTADAFELPTALKNGALPFHKSSLPSPLASPSEPKPPPPTNTAGETMPLGTKTLMLGAVLPFGTDGATPPNPPPFPRMPIETYASFCAELAVFPDKAAEVEKKYKIRSDAARAALDQDWQVRFDAHPETRTQWQGLVAHYREWLQRQPRA